MKPIKIIVAAVMLFALAACAKSDPRRVYDPSRPNLYAGKVYSPKEAKKNHCWITGPNGSVLWACEGPEPEWPDSEYPTP